MDLSVRDWITYMSIRLEDFKPGDLVVCNPVFETYGKYVGLPVEIRLEKNIDSAAVVVDLLHFEGRLKILHEGSLFNVRPYHYLIIQES